MDYPLFPLLFLSLPVIVIFLMFSTNSATKKDRPAKQVKETVMAGYFSVVVWFRPVNRNVKGLNNLIKKNGWSCSTLAYRAGMFGGIRTVRINGYSSDYAAVKSIGKYINGYIDDY